MCVTYFTLDKEQKWILENNKMKAEYLRNKFPISCVLSLAVLEVLDNVLCVSSSSIDLEMEMSLRRFGRNVTTSERSIVELNKSSDFRFE
ncbi:hypothetical protein TNCT_719011 [Trichonephila clavata]|uniref:Uncharacterized protein n=1 Tax=Trichonephila clavata TaxID=2740835 RepID=A0A8X6HI59_TRICU|nr:hypothetical protein TNCT_719011 [Trichonephila clavata]